MAFALSKFVAYGRHADEAVNKRVTQRVVLQITSTTADVDLDIGDASGTFWTAVGVTNAGLKALQDITSRARGGKCVRVDVDALTVARVKAAAASGEAFAVAQGTYGPNITMDAANGIDGAAVIVIEWELKAGETAVEYASAATA